MLDFLKWETLLGSWSVEALSFREKRQLTLSFSTILAAPATEEDSNVNMELWRWHILSNLVINLDFSDTHVKSRQLLPVHIKLVVVELGELL